MAAIIDGRAIARELDEKTKAEVDALVAAGKPRPGLAVILVGHDGASEVYVRRKMKSSDKVGILSFEHRLPEDTSQDTLLALIARLNADPKVHGILVQVPLPAHIDTGIVLRGLGRQAMLERADADLLAALHLAADIDLACPVVTDEDHRQPRARLARGDQRVDFGLSLLVQLARDRAPVDDRGHLTNASRRTG